MKKLLKFILKQVIKCIVFFVVSTFIFYACTKVKTAYADYYRSTVYSGSDLTLSSNNTIVRTPTIAYDTSSTGYIVISVDPKPQNTNTVYALYSSGGNTRKLYFTPDEPLDISSIYSIPTYIRISGVASEISAITSITYSVVYPGSDPDIGTASYEQRYNTDYLYSGSFTRSLTERVIFARWYPDDLFPNMNSIEVNGSTVGNNQLQFRISYISNGVIIGSSAWFDSGFKMPISDQVEYDYLSIGLRLPDENDPTGFYDLQPSELDLCVVTVGYRTKVYMSLEPADQIPLTTQDFSIEVPTIDYDDLDTANINGFDDYITVIAQATSGLLSASGIMPFVIFLFVLSVIFFFLVG